MAIEITFSGIKPNPGDGSARVTFHVTGDYEQPANLELNFNVPNPASLDAAVKKAREQLLAFATALTEAARNQSRQNPPFQ